MLMASLTRNVPFFTPQCEYCTDSWGNPYNHNPYNHNPYCVEILIGLLEILIGILEILIGQFMDFDFDFFWLFRL